METSSFHLSLLLLIGCQTATPGDTSAAPSAAPTSSTPLAQSSAAASAPIPSTPSAQATPALTAKLATPCSHASKDDRWVRRILEGIARAAADRYQHSGALCTSAADAPLQIPTGGPAAPREAPGEDFESGDEHGGWRCLRYAITQPVAYRYGYRISDFRGPARGLPDPGAHGFEASAEADLDGDGSSSLYTMIGSLDGTSIKLQPDVFCADPGE